MDILDQPTREQLARDIFSIAQRAGMPDTYWRTDSRIARACTVLDLTPDQARETDWSTRTPPPGPGDALTAPAPVTSPSPVLTPAGPIEVWTDGACSGNPGPGGWGWTTNEPTARSNWGWDVATTNNRMEIQAVIEALTDITERPVVVVTDSRYVIDAFEKNWWKGWVKRDWKTSQGKPVLNRELWDQLIRLVVSQPVTFRWVKGHNGHVLNEVADGLAVRGRDHASRVRRESR